MEPMKNNTGVNVHKLEFYPPIDLKIKCIK